MRLGKRAVLLAAVAGALLSASVARANGDPASDYLLTQSVFLPFTQTIDQNEVKRLNALLKEANKQHYRIRVAIIMSPSDLGTAFSLFDKPQKYSEFLGLELSFVYRDRLLVVMPKGYGSSVNGDPDPKAAQVLKNLPPPGRNATKEVEAAIVAVQRLAAAEGHHLKVPQGAGAPRRGTASPSQLLRPQAPRWSPPSCSTGGRNARRRPRRPRVPYALPMVTCPNCGQENPPLAKFCSECGAALAAQSGLAEERKVVTVLFADLVGFTARSERLDPEDVRAILTPYFARVRNEVESFGGTVEKFIGDAVMAVFGAPVAYGDDPERAVRAAVAIREAVHELNEADPDLDLQMRIAVNTGEALVTLSASAAHGEGMVTGDVVNTASRLQEAAPVNGILVGEETFRATRSAIDYDEAGEVVAKGKQLPVRVWRALAPTLSPGERRRGRCRCSVARPSSACSSGSGRTSSPRSGRSSSRSSARPGSGSRAWPPSSSISSTEPRCRVIRGRSLPYGEVTPYGAFAAQVKQVAAMFDTDTDDAASEKLSAAMAALVDEDAAELAAHIAMLIGVGKDGGVGDRQTLFFAARRLVEALALDRPTVLVFDDIHVSASSMLDLLETLASRVRDVPLMLLTLARPELSAERPTWGSGLPAYVALPLERLGEDHSEELGRRLLVAAGADARTANELAAKAEGNPLFIEELATSLVEGRSSAGELPSSIRGIIAARLDTLPPVEREVVLDASVFGKVFWSGALTSSAEDRPARLEALDSLEGRDLIRRDPVSRLQGEQQFAFRHQLIREVAYSILPRALRTKRHRAIALFLEGAASEAGDVAPALAHHWREAGEPERAVDYLLAGADQANRGWAKDEAFRLYSEALELVPEDAPERRREIGKRLAVVAQAAYHSIDAERLVRHSRPESEPG